MRLMTLCKIFRFRGLSQFISKNEELKDSTLCQIPWCRMTSEKLNQTELTTLLSQRTGKSKLLEHERSKGTGKNLTVFCRISNIMASFTCTDHNNLSTSVVFPNQNWQSFCTLANPPCIEILSKTSQES